jgi:protein with PEP-CTERM/exosortase system signal
LLSLYPTGENIMNKIKYIAAVLIGIAGLGLQQAKADAFTSSLNVGNPDLAAFGSGPYGSVLVTLTGNTAQIEFTAAAGYQFVDGAAAAVNINGSFQYVNGSLVDAAAGATVVTGSQPPVDGFGDFNLQVNNGNSSLGVTYISFQVTGSWASAADVLALNPLYDAAAHIRPTINNPNGLTGYAAETGGHIVPDGGTTVMLLGMALGALGMARRFLAG